MAIYRNVASQKIAVFAYDKTTGAAKTGDAANITAYLSKDWGAAAAVADTNPTEMDATNMPGWYAFDLAQAETNAEVMVIAPKSVTANVVIDQVQVFTEYLTPDRIVLLDTLSEGVPLADNAVSAAALSAAAIDEILDEVVEGSLTLRQILRILLAEAVGKAAGGGTTSITFRDQADTKNRIAATVDASGNRSAVTLDAS